LQKVVNPVETSFWNFTAHKLFDKCHVLVVEDFSLKNWSKHPLVKTNFEKGNLVYWITWSGGEE
jgi:hypothetical protein